MAGNGILSGLRSFLFGSASNGNQPSSASKSLARSRLHFVLVQDRTGLSADDMAKFKAEMVEVIERYFVIEDRELDISYKRDSDSTTLLINSPIKVRRLGDSSSVRTEQGGRGKKAAKAVESVEKECDSNCQDITTPSHQSDKSPSNEASAATANS